MLNTEPYLPSIWLLTPSVRVVLSIHLMWSSLVHTNNTFTLWRTHTLSHTFCLSFSRVPQVFSSLFFSLSNLSVLHTYFCSQNYWIVTWFHHFITPSTNVVNLRSITKKKNGEKNYVKPSIDDDFDASPIEWCLSIEWQTNTSCHILTYRVDSPNRHRESNNSNG